MTPGLWIAALAAFGYTLASFLLKLALGRGASSAQVNLTANLAMALLAQPLWLLARPSPTVAGVAAACAVTFFLGQIFTFAALASGDVSVATPVLGTKILWVTFFSAGIFGVEVSARWWWAALAATAGVAVVAASDPRRQNGRSLRTAGFALLAAVSYSLTDVLVQQWEGSAFDLLPAMFGLVGLFAAAWYAAGDRRAFRPHPRFALPLAAGAALLALQSGMVFLALSWTRDATAVNIVYSARSLMSVAGAWFAGRWFGLREAAAPRRVFALRMAGAVLLFAAILLIVWK